MSTMKGGTMKIEDVTMTQRPTFFQKLKAHYRKWWWVHLIFFIASFLLITLLLVYVGFPNIAQDNVNKSGLEINAQKLSNAKPDSIHMTINSTSTSDSMYHPRLSSFNASMSIPDSAASPFGYLQIPDSQAGKAVPIFIEQDVQIANMSEWIRFNTQALKQEEFKIRIKGRMGLQEGSLPHTTTDYNKVVTLKGLNGLKGFKILNQKASLGTGATSKITADVFLPNPSVLTLEMGDVTMNLFVDGSQIGVTTLKDLTLSPGGVKVPMTGTTETKKVLGLLKKYPTGILPVEIHGNRSVVNGVEVPYFGEVLASNVLKTDFDVSAALSGGL